MITLVPHPLIHPRPPPRRALRLPAIHKARPRRHTRINLVPIIQRNRRPIPAATVTTTSTCALARIERTQPPRTAVEFATQINSSPFAAMNKEDIDDFKKGFVGNEEKQTDYKENGVLFFALLFSALSSMAGMPASFAQRPIVLRQKQAAMYHPFIEGSRSALTIVNIPITFSITITFGILIYFIVMLQQMTGQFFTFYLFLFTMSATMKAWFRAIEDS